MFSLLRKHMLVDKRVSGTVIDSKPRLDASKRQQIWRFVRIFFYTAIQGRWVDGILVQASTSGIISLVIPIQLLAKFMRTPVFVRLIGGGLDVEYDSSRKLKRWLLVHALKRIDGLFIETRWQVRFTESIGCSNTIQVPNCRPIPQETMPEDGETDYSRDRFVFISQVRRDKGIDALLEATYLLDEQGISVDVYGPLIDVSRSELDSASNLHYRGNIDPEGVVETLTRYAALVLPTRYAGEGYPGVILEAFAAGVPVIATRWRSIPEIVHDGENGILIDPYSPATALVDAMISLTTDADRRTELAEGARRAAQHFHSDTWHALLIGRICAIIHA